MERRDGNLGHSPWGRELCEWSWVRWAGGVLPRPAEGARPTAPLETPAAQRGGRKRGHKASVGRSHVGDTLLAGDSLGAEGPYRAVFLGLPQGSLKSLQGLRGGSQGPHGQGMGQRDTGHTRTLAVTQRVSFLCLPTALPALWGGNVSTAGGLRDESGVPR